MSETFLHQARIQPGVIVHFDEPVPGETRRRHVWVTCRCGEKRLAYLPTGQKDRATWTGLCVPCSGVYRRARSKDETHATGTIIHWGERDPDKPWERVAITCHQCQGKSITHIQSIKHSKWSGLCSSCIELRGSHLKFTHDEHFENGTIIHYGEPDPKAPDKRVMVTCGECKEKRSMTRVTASWLKHNGGSWRCRKCHRNALRTFFASNRATPKSQKTRGRPPKEKGLSQGDEQLKARFEEIVLMLSERLPPNKIKRKVIAKEYSARGEQLDPSTVTARIKKLYEKHFSVDDAVAFVLSKKREFNSGN